MPLKDDLLGWYIKNFVMVGAQVFDKPAFIVWKFQSKTRVYARQLIFPEYFINELENRLVKENSNGAKPLLYAAGKKFGYRVGKQLQFYTVNDLSDQKFNAYLDLLSKFLEGTFADKLQITDLNVEKKYLKMELDNFVSCNKTGLGYFIPTGVSAGMWAYLLNDIEIEAVHIKCQGRGDPMCELSYSKNLTAYGNEEKLIFRDLEGLDIGTSYESMNSIRKTNFSKVSFQECVNAKIFSYKYGKISDSLGRRYFLLEAGGLYLIELELCKEAWSKKILEEAAFFTGCEFSKLLQKNITTAMNFLGAFGFGDVFIRKKNGKYIVVIDFFPWTTFANSIEFIIMRCFFEGILSSIDDRKIKLAKFSTSVHKGFLSLSTEEIN
jgi:predicted hydrocarbon binding protein